MKKKIGILGGTFDPPHYGHLLIAQEALVQCGLEEIWFIPSQIPPHKQRENLTSSQARKHMVELAIGDNERFFVSNIELVRDGPSYTVNTMKELVKRHPESEFYFIIGGDMIDYLPKWNSIDMLLSLVTFIGIKRPGFPSTPPYPNNIIEIDTVQLEISSTDIRKKVKEGNNIRYLLPEAVRLFIKETGIYAEG